MRKPTGGAAFGIDLDIAGLVQAIGRRARSDNVAAILSEPRAGMAPLPSGRATWDFTAGSGG